MQVQPLKEAVAANTRFVLVTASLPEAVWTYLYSQFPGIRPVLGSGLHRSASINECNPEQPPNDLLLPLLSLKSSLEHCRGIQYLMESKGFDSLSKLEAKRR